MRIGQRPSDGQVLAACIWATAAIQRGGAARREGLPAGAQLADEGGLEIRDITDEVQRGRRGERRRERDRLRLLASYDLLRARERVRDGFLEDFIRMLRRLVPSEKYYAHDDWDRRTENVCPGGHGVRERPLALHGDAPRPRRRVDPGPRRRAVPRHLAARPLHGARPLARPALDRPGRRRLIQGAEDCSPPSGLDRATSLARPRAALSSSPGRSANSPAETPRAPRPHSARASRSDTRHLGELVRALRSPSGDLGERAIVEDDVRRDPVGPGPLAAPVPEAMRRRARSPPQSDRRRIDHGRTSLELEAPRGSGCPSDCCPAQKEVSPRAGDPDVEQPPLLRDGSSSSPRLSPR